MILLNTVRYGGVFNAACRLCDPNRLCITQRSFHLKAIKINIDETVIIRIITACKRSLRRLCFYTCLSVILFRGGGDPRMHCMWYPRMPCRSPGGGIPACLAGLQAHTLGEVEGSGLGGGGLQAHTQGES